MTDALFPRTLMLLGSGELGKELAIAAQRLGCRVIAVDRYAGAPAMQVADAAEVIAMTDPEALKAVVRHHRPDLLIPEIEALAVEALLELEAEGFTVIPTARATAVTMNRDRIRDLAADELGLRTARFAYASSPTELAEAAAPLGWPVVVKPVMSSSGKGQSMVEGPEEIAAAWQAAMAGARGAGDRVIVEEFLRFEQEITLLTVKQWDGPTLFCPPIGHLQERGDYQCSWQPAELGAAALATAEAMALAVTDQLGGAGLFGVEFFLCGPPGQEVVVFSELSPRPHDTGLVTLRGQNLSEFELHLRAVLGLPIPSIRSSGAAASRVILAPADCTPVAYSGVAEALAEPDTQLLLFGKPEARPLRRMGVVVSGGCDLAEARTRADRAASRVQVMTRV
ncbi:formate-dependent phosphoribosylglycinamide formyltransferase [Synechococcus sp. CS-1325]|uniref:formate-dependent phosphoribosylglycinamide formyltransferase n=1 Tax=unclassified Synechococcus TaxID=2626047 RepID=UPI000DB48102|nr:MULTISPECIES: formate-dependent phosphoribosylglycinamide formyltransferase [unclassified Synechococcus]PZV02323.1 MAG: phosphoribosylglycinamide formyltransferase 2 [Cyanobium sp.]MCT0199190.1 formate-dependent phosphoribosylglycinamide formyltransferase [Synechococcus sp. CS-1325]MCT0214631.1 formate-dependent phosphoribosylglycinamide formyltransferase [Synechococcus sp. CS-1326]MCT0231188.1 formate-dependent phosphoribosylglycinamide formyltransferase [Synechococcus sp. CS-1324]MCT02339